jgi:putative FmdB family regulatory protein
MPTYEYACRDCGEHLEVVQSFRDTPLTVCGSCGGALRKVFSAAGIIFKGSGYYVTDTRGKGAKTEVDASAKGSGKGGSSDKGGEGTAAGSDSSSSDSSSSDSSSSDSSSSSGSDDKRDGAPSKKSA